MSLECRRPVGSAACWLHGAAACSTGGRRVRAWCSEGDVLHVQRNGLTSEVADDASFGCFPFLRQPRRLAPVRRNHVTNAEPLWATFVRSHALRRQPDKPKGLARAAWRVLTQTTTDAN